MKKYITMIALLFLVCVLAFAHLNRSGDVNCDGKVTTTDLVILSRYLAEMDELPCPRNADMNQDGLIDILDLVQLRMNLAGLE